LTRSAGKLRDWLAFEFFRNFEDVMFLALGRDVGERPLLSAHLFRVKQSEDLALGVVTDCEFRFGISFSGPVSCP
jgi:hypothetical protein